LLIENYAEKTKSAIQNVIQGIFEGIDIVLSTIRVSSKVEEGRN
jgi:hypothetical protein